MQIWPHLVPSEAKGSQLRLEVPHHHTAIQGPGHKLLHVLVEAHAGGRILVSPEGPLKGGVFHLKELQRARLMHGVPRAALSGDMAMSPGAPYLGLKLKGLAIFSSSSCHLLLYLVQKSAKVLKIFRADRTDSGPKLQKLKLDPAVYTTIILSA